MGGTEEEIKFEKSDEDLVDEKATSHLNGRTDLLVDAPAKLLE